MKGILLAGGSGTRLYPTTRVVSKQLLPVYDKPTIYYPLSTLMLAGIREILVISTPRDVEPLRQLLGSGSELGLKLSYEVQDKPRGIADAFRVGADFVGTSPVCLILGDNLFYGHDLPRRLQHVAQHIEGATVFGYHVRDPERYGVVEFDEAGRPRDIVEKPQNPRSHWAVTGLYFYDADVVRIARGLQPSARGELEITDLNRAYLRGGRLNVERLGRGFAWLDTGTPSALLEASAFVQTLQHRQGVQLACLEEIAFTQGWIGFAAFQELVKRQPASEYGEHLRRILEAIVESAPGGQRGQRSVATREQAPIDHPHSGAGATE